MKNSIRFLGLAFGVTVAMALGACGDSAPAPDTETESVDAPAVADPPAVADERAGTVYGEPLADVETVAIADLYARIDEFEGKPVRVEGLVTDVCAKRGCWIKLAGDDAPQPVTFKVVDGVMVFPMSAAGKTAVADGTARKIELSLEKTREYLGHLAEESGDEFDPASVTEPMTMVKLEGIGARVLDKQTHY